MKTSHLKYLRIEENKLIISEEDKQRYSQLLNLVLNHSRAYSLILNNKQCQKPKVFFSYGFKSMQDKEELVQWIIEKTPKLINCDYCIKTRVYWILNGMDDFPRCQYEKCNKIIGIGMNVGNNGYPHHCCQGHSGKDRKCQMLAKQTKQTRYGNPVFNNRKKAKNTCQTRYGKDITNPSQLQSVKDKKCQTTMKNYGVEHPAQSQEVMDEIRSTNNDKYGVDYTTQCPEIIEKIKQTTLKNYGVPNIFYLSETAYKGIQVKIDKYGTVKGNVRRYVYDGISFDSSWELCTWIYFKDNGHQIEREPCEFLYLKNGKIHKYYPDFMIDGKYVEIKGNNFFDKNGNPIYNGKHLWTEKYQCMIDNNVEIYTYDKVKQFIMYVNKKYGKDYIKQYLITKTTINKTTT